MRAARRAERRTPPEVDAYLASLDPAALRALILELAATSAQAARMLRLYASPVGSSVQQELMAQVSEALANVDLGYHDYYRYDYYDDEDDERCAELLSVLGEVEEHLDGGHADQMLPVLRHALTSLCEVSDEHEGEADDLIGNALDRTVQLYAEACRAGNPDTVELAEWLADFRLDAPDWLGGRWESFAAALDERGWDAYRRAVTNLDARRAEGDGFDAISRMQLELADRDGDVDRAIELLQRKSSTPFPTIIQRLRDAGRDADALTWLDRAVREDCIGTGGHSRRPEVEISVVADLYLTAGRADDALTALMSVFRRACDSRSYLVLLETAGKVGREAELRRSAREYAAGRAATDGGQRLVHLLIADGDIHAAWEAADAYGPGESWRELAQASEEQFPLRSADLYRPALAASLEAPPNTKLYPGIASMLATMRRLYADAGRPAEIDIEIRRIRESYRRRPALMAELDRAGLPR